MKIISIVSYCLLFLILTISASMAQDMNPEAGKLFNEGNKLLKEGNYNGAVGKYDNALKIEKDYRIYYQKGIALKNSGKMDEAENSFEEVIKLKADFEAAYNALGGVYFRDGKYDQAIKNFEKVLEISSNNSIKNKVKNNLSIAYAKAGNVAISNGNSEQAINYLNKAVEYDNYDAAYLSLAKIYSEIGEYDKAIDAGEKALKYKSSISKGGPYYYLGVSYKNKGDLTKAKEMFNQARSDATYKKLVDYELSLLN